MGWASCSQAGLEDPRNQGIKTIQDYTCFVAMTHKSFRTTGKIEAALAVLKSGGSFLSGWASKIQSGAGLGKPSKAEGTLAPDSRPEARTRSQAGQEGVNLQGELGFSQTGSLCPALLLPTPGRSPGICSLCHHPPLACLFISTVMETTVPRNLQRPGFGGRGGV